MARLFHVGVSVAAVAVLAVACRDAKPTESIRAIGAKPQNVCFVNPGGTSCSCDAIPGPPFWTGVWPDCTQVPSLFHIKIAVDSMTLALGDTTLFRVTAPGATTLQIQSYSFDPTGPVLAAVTARQQRGIGPRSPTGAAGTTVNPLSMTATFLLPRTAPSQGTVDRPGTPGRGVEGVTVVPPRRSHDSWGLDTLGDCTQGTLLPACYYAPPQSGYMLVTGMVDGEQQRDSAYVQVIQHAATLVLTCSNPAGQSDSTTHGTTVVRADTVSCSASVSSGSVAALHIIGWNFRSDDGEFALDRSGNDDASYAIDSTRWRGPVVTPGKVTLSASLANIPATATAPIQVVPRAWANRAIPYFPYPQPLGQGNLPAEPDSVADLGQTVFSFDSSFVVLVTDSILGHVQSGPNFDMLYATGIPKSTFISISIWTNDAALSSRSTFYNAQVRDNSNFLPPIPCSQSTVVSSSTRRKILAHEGDSLQALSHARLWTDSARYWFGRQVERVVATGPQLRARWMTDVQTLFPVLRRAAKRADDINKVDFGCTFNFNYR
ncbi:MAG: hypothetical protein HY084_07455 [Gemmatimonadetes bacterium]|nr:hypothetical protein [Gemmatimonadota bacterium]